MILPAMNHSTDSVLTALRWRYATKSFDPARRIAPEIWAALEESLVLTPSSFGLQPWRFLIVENPAVRADLRAHSWNQPQITDASHLVVFAAKTDVSESDIDSWVGRLAEVQGTPLDALAPLKGMIGGFVGNMPQEARHFWNIRQIYIALGQFMATAAYDDVLGLKDSGYATAVACAAGYRAADDHTAARPKARYAAGDVIRRI